MAPKDSISITPELLLQAYCSGVFPMADSQDADEVFWVDPNERGIIPIGGFHASRSLTRRLRKRDFEIRINSDFPAVLRACADRDETWINAEIFNLYCALHQLGYAHSVEVWKNNTLIGGVYGVAIGGAFFGESMFSHAPDGSKIALAYLLDILAKAGYRLCDTQFISPHLASLGGVEISRQDYHNLLERALATSAEFPHQPPSELGAGSSPVLATTQPNTQTS